MVRLSYLRICSELQAQPGDHVGRCSSVQKGGETNGLPRLVDVSCEVEGTQCQDMFCIIHWVAVRHRLGLSGVRDRLETGSGGGSSKHCVGGKVSSRSYPTEEYRMRLSSEVHNLL
jgi:hypothetical protein